MENQFRATFTADTSNFSSQMRQMRADSQQMASEMIKDAFDIADSTKQNVNKVLQEQIALYEKRRELIKSDERMQLDAKYSGKLSTSTSPHDKAAVQAQWEKSKSDLSEQFKKDDLQIDLLREVIATLKDTATQEMVSNADKAADNIRAINEGKTSHMSSDERYKAVVQAGFQEKKKEEKADDTMKETAKGVFIGELLASAVRKLGSVATGVVGSSDGEIAASKLWSAIPVVGDALAEAQARHINLAESRDRAALYIRARGANVGLLTDERIEANNTLELDEKTRLAHKQGIDLQDNVKVSNLSKEAAENAARMKRNAEKGRDQKLKVDAEAKQTNEMYDSWKYLEAGVDSVDFIQRASKLVTALGTAKGLQRQTKAMIDITQGGAIEEGTALSVANLINKAGGGDLRSTMGSIVGELSGTNTKANRDRAVNQVVDLSNSRYGSGFSNVDPVRMAKVVSAFQSNFGSALSSTDNISGVMNSMANPKDEYQQSLNYRIYAAQMAKEGKEVSYTGFMKWQEKPEEGLMGGKMDYLKNVYGDGQYGELAFNAAGIGKTWEANEMYLKGGTKGLSAEEIMAKSKKSIGFDATEQVTNRQQLQAQLTDAYTKGMMSGIKEAFSQVADAIGRQSATTAALLGWLKGERKN